MPPRGAGAEEGFRGYGGSAPKQLSELSRGKRNKGLKQKGAGRGGAVGGVGFAGQRAKRTNEARGHAAKRKATKEPSPAGVSCS